MFAVCWPAVDCSTQHCRHRSLVLDFTSLVLTYFVLGSLGTAARTHGEHGELQCPHTTMVTPQQWQSVTGVTRVMIAGCQVATGQAAGCWVLGAGRGRQPIIVMMMGRAAGGHLVHPLLSTATVSAMQRGIFSAAMQMIFKCQRVY